MISITTAMALTGLSKRTIWRRITAGTFEGIAVEGNQTKISLTTIKPYIRVPLENQDYDLIRRADAGSPEAQSDLALIFLKNDKPQGAFYWLELAAQQDLVDAMHLLGRCYTDGNGIPKDENLGIMWIAKAASKGHVLAMAQMQGISGRFSLRSMPRT